MHGIRTEDALESAIAQPMNVGYYGNGDLYVQAARFSAAQRHRHRRFAEMATYEALIRVPETTLLTSGAHSLRPQQKEGRLIKTAGNMIFINGLQPFVACLSNNRWAYLDLAV